MVMVGQKQVWPEGTQTKKVLTPRGPHSRVLLSRHQLAIESLNEIRGDEDEK